MTLRALSLKAQRKRMERLVEHRGAQAAGERGRGCWFCRLMAWLRSL